MRFAGDFPRVVLLLAAMLPVGIFRGCTREPEKRSEPVRVVTTVYALADMVRQIGGDRVIVEWFVESGQSLEELSETPQRRAQVRSADLVVTRGALDPWTLRGAGNEYIDRRILRVDALPASRETDPRLYMWLDPQVAIELCDELAARLAGLQPESEKFFRENATSLRRKIVALTDAARAPLDASNGAFMTVDRGFVSLARRMGLEEVRLPEIRLDDPTAYGTRVIQETAQECGARAVFANAQTPVALLRDWEARLKLAVLPLDALGSSALSGRSTYLAVLQYNLEQLKQGMSLGMPRQRKPRELAPLGAPIESEPEFAVTPENLQPTTAPQLTPQIELPREYRRVPLPPPTTRSLPPALFDPIPTPEKKPVR